jgi:hypothetical protein
MSISLKKKREAVAATFGIPVDPEDVEFIDFMYARRDLATVRERGHRELQYVVEIDNIEHLIIKMLGRIRKRDGEKIFREAATYPSATIDGAMSERRHRVRTKGNGAAVHV